MTVTSREFFMWGQKAEVVVRVKHSNGTTLEVPVTDVTYRPSESYSELRIPLRGQWFDKLIETHDFSSRKRGS